MADGLHRSTIRRQRGHYRSARTREALQSQSVVSFHFISSHLTSSHWPQHRRTILLMMRRPGTCRARTILQFSCLLMQNARHVQLFRTGCVMAGDRHRRSWSPMTPDHALRLSSARPEFGSTPELVQSHLQIRLIMEPYAIIVEPIAASDETRYCAGGPAAIESYGGPKPNRTDEPSRCTSQERTPWTTSTS